MQGRVLKMLAAVLAAGSAPDFAVVERWLAPAESLMVVARIAADSVQLAAAETPVAVMEPGLERLVLEELAPVELVLRWSTR